jgi:hypothetical protein
MTQNTNLMKPWHSISLGDGMTSATPSAEIETLFQPLFAAAGSPADMAVFTRSESEGRLHCEVIAYFSPALLEVAEAFDAQPCAQPARAGLSLLAGDERSWRVLFPDSI